MNDVYCRIPTLYGSTLTLRPLAMTDAPALHLVYGDPVQAATFNSDNCTGSFHCPALQDMEQAIRFWLDSYHRGEFVRWTVVELFQPIGTVECFRRVADDAFTDCALLRIDLRSDRAVTVLYQQLLSVLLPLLEDMFHCSQAAIKAPPVSAALIAALENHGFALSDEVILGHHEERYGDYWRRAL